MQCQKDARHKRITSQISLIECELAELTMLEIEQRDMQLDMQMVRPLSAFVDPTSVSARTHTHTQLFNGRWSL